MTKPSRRRVVLTDKERLDWLLKLGHDLSIRDIRPRAGYMATLWFDTRKAIDAAISATRAREDRP